MCFFLISYDITFFHVLFFFFNMPQSRETLRSWRKRDDM
jgi:hypothetical protein